MKSPQRKKPALCHPRTANPYTRLLPRVIVRAAKGGGVRSGLPPGAGPHFLFEEWPEWIRLRIQLVFMKMKAGGGVSLTVQHPYTPNARPSGG